jgi:hypothetical protein
MISKGLIFVAAVLAIVSTVNSLPLQNALQNALQNGLQDNQMPAADDNGNIMISLNLKISIDNGKQPNGEHHDIPNGRPEMNNTWPIEQPEGQSSLPPRIQSTLPPSGQSSIPPPPPSGQSSLPPSGQSSIPPPPPSGQSTLPPPPPSGQSSLPPALTTTRAPTAAPIG